MDTRGEHILVDVRDLVDPSILSQPQELIDLLRAGAEKAGATVLRSEYHTFDIDEMTCGISVILILSESHVSAHTWPESNYISMDIYTCGSCNPAVAMEHISEKLNGTVVYHDHIIRGVY